MPTSKTYAGVRHLGAVRVTVETQDRDDAGRTIASQQSLLRPTRRESPVGFEWGYHGSGPDDLAHAILVDHYGRNETAYATAEAEYKEFSDRVIANLATDKWELTTAKVEEALFVQRRDAHPALVMLPSANMADMDVLPQAIVMLETANAQGYRRC